MRAALTALVASVATAATAAAPRRQPLTLKVLAQRRPAELSRLLQSVAAARYPADAVVDVEIHVDACRKSPGLFARRDPKCVSGRKAVLAAAKAWTPWRHGAVTIIKAKENKGIREAWLSAYDPSLTGEELGRILILEDDVELSPAWYLYLQDSIREYGGAPGVAGISLQRQAARLDVYAKDLDSTKKQGALAPLTLPSEDGLYLFPHVGSWGFAPEPKVWEAFLEWMASLNDVDDPRHFSVGRCGTPYKERSSSYKESIPTRWYRGLIANGRGDAGADRAQTDSMWTAHFDAFCAMNGLSTVHPRITNNEEALAVSYRTDGAHYQGINEADARLVAIDGWPALEERLFPADAPLPLTRVDFGGERVPADQELLVAKRFGNFFAKGASQHWKANFERSLTQRRRLYTEGEDLDVAWTYPNGWAAVEASNDLDETPNTEALLGGLQHGYAPLDDVTQDRAKCILKNKRVAILGDSITRYFAFTLNYFLKTGEVPEDGFGGKWGGAKRGGDPLKWRGSDYFDEGDIWTDDSSVQSPFSTRADHRQKIDQTTNGIETTFYFIQKTWYKPLEDLAPTLRNYDVIVANSAWWDIQRGGGEDKCISKGMYENADCLATYESQLTEMSSNILQAFGSSKKAAMFRTSNCCGGTSSGAEIVKEGAIAVSAMNTLAHRVFTERDVEIMDVEDTANVVNIGKGSGDPDGRTFDGGHPRSAVYYAWVQLFLNKVARQLNRESCNAVWTSKFYGASTRHTGRFPHRCFETPNPTFKPTPRPTAAAGSPCNNGQQDGAETDVDCGGPECGTCVAGKSCAANNDCETSFCSGGVCTWPATATPTPEATEVEAPTPYIAPTPTPPTDNGKPTEPPCDGYDCGKPTRDLSTCDVGKDQITYARDGKQGFRTIQDQLFDVCPSSGQMVLLAVALGVLVASLICFCLVYPKLAARKHRAATPYRGKGPAKRGAGPGENAVTPSPSPPKEGRKKPIDSELSSAALHVLKQMESRESDGGRRGSARHSLDPISETAPGHSQGHSRRASRHSRHGGRSRYAPTTESRLSRAIALDGREGAHTRASRYSEYRRESGRPTMVSSVAFSLYDGGDSEDESDEEEEVAAFDEEAGVAPAPPVVGKKTLMACIAAVQLGLLLVIAEIGNSRMPAGFIPAGTVTQAENIDLWTFIMLSLAFASLWCLRSVAAPGEDVDPATACFLSRAQANEWKGWMQVAFVAYHYTNAQDVYVPIRWCVSAYVWLTGFGNGVYFWASADFSPKRFVQQIWRMNFLAALLAMATNTAWIDYYFVALATVHFVLIFISLGIARLLGKCLKWPSPDRKKGVEACDAEKFVGWLIMIIITLALWVPPQLHGMQRNDARKTLYDYVFKGWMTSINQHLANYFWQRTRMDYLSSISGLMFAAVYARFRDKWRPPRYSEMKPFSTFARVVMFVISAVLLFVAIYVAKLPAYCCNGGHEYRKINAYISTLWIPAYLIARNATPWLMDRVSAPMEWIGMHSLEFYLLQFHVFMTRESSMVLYIIPKEKWGYTNMVIVGFDLGVEINAIEQALIYVLLCIKALELTNVTRAIVWRCSTIKVFIGVVWTVFMYGLFEGYFKKQSHPCSTIAWVVWWFFAVIATLCLVIWTLLDLRSKPPARR